MGREESYALFGKEPQITAREIQVPRLLARPLLFQKGYCSDLQMEDGRMVPGCRCNGDKPKNPGNERMPAREATREASQSLRKRAGCSQLLNTGARVVAVVGPPVHRSNDAFTLSANLVILRHCQPK